MIRYDGSIDNRLCGQLTRENSRSLAQLRCVSHLRADLSLIPMRLDMRPNHSQESIRWLTRWLRGSSRSITGPCGALVFLVTGPFNTRNILMSVDLKTALSIQRMMGSTTVGQVAEHQATSPCISLAAGASGGTLTGRRRYCRRLWYNGLNHWMNGSATVDPVTP